VISEFPLVPERKFTWKVRVIASHNSHTNCWASWIYSIYSVTTCDIEVFGIGGMIAVILQFLKDIELLLREIYGDDFFREENTHCQFKKLHFLSFLPSFYSSVWLSIYYEDVVQNVFGILALCANVGLKFGGRSPRPTWRARLETQLVITHMQPPVVKITEVGQGNRWDFFSGVERRSRAVQKERRVAIDKVARQLGQPIIGMSGLFDLLTTHKTEATH